jgi:hypothetical protein
MRCDTSLFEIAYLGSCARANEELHVPKMPINLLLGRVYAIIGRVKYCEAGGTRHTPAVMIRRLRGGLTMDTSLSGNTPQHNPSHTKYCEKCDEWLPFSKFSKLNRSRDKLQTVCKECQAKYSKLITAEKKRDWNIRRIYGITLEQYNRMLEEQCNVCACCGQPETRAESRSKRGAMRNLYIDHCHKTGDVRSLLCQECNTALGMMDENPDRIQKLKEYAEWCQTRKPDVRIIQLKLVE